MRRDLCGGLLGTGGYDLRCRLSRLRTGWGRLSLGWRLLGGGLGLLRDLSGGLLWTGGYDLRGRLCRLGTSLSRLSLSLRLLSSSLGLRLLGGSLGLCGNLSGGLLWTGGYDLRGRLS